MATCNICRAQYEWGKNPCWRCGEDNSFWEAQRTRSFLDQPKDFFLNVWGVIAIVIDVFALVLLVWMILESMAWGYPDLEVGLVANRARIFGQSLAWFLSFITIFVIYAVRFELWSYSWIRHILKPTPPNLYTVAVILFLLGVLLLLIYFTTSLFFASAAGQGVGAAGGQDFYTALFNKVVMPTMYGFIFACFTGGSTLMSAGLFVARLNEQGGQPIFMNTQLLADVVQKAAAESLELPLSATKPSAIKRTEQGGIKMIVTYSGPAAGQGSADGPEPKEARFTVEADKWGQIESLIEESKTTPS